MSTLNPILDVITSDEEEQLLYNVEKENIEKYVANGRYIVRYGNSIYANYIKSKTIPDYLIKLSEKLIAAGILDEMPASITINLYKPGCFIPPHIDDLNAGPVITILSIGSDAELVLTHGGESKSVLLPTKSVFQLKDEYRTIWMHSVPKVKKRRISIVFRQEGK
jgi:alkylated DNA repair dioxygenase AlkB